MLSMVSSRPMMLCFSHHKMGRRVLEISLSSSPSLCYFLNSKQKVTKAFWDKWFMSVDGMEWDGAWKWGKWSYMALLVVSDKKPTKTVSSKIRGILAPKTGKPKWMDLGAVWLEPRILNYSNFNFNESLKWKTSKNVPISMVFMGWFKSFKWQV